MIDILVQVYRGPFPAATIVAAGESFSITGLAVALLAGLFALGGSLLGARLGQSNEHKQWLRNEKIVAYREYMSSYFGLAQLNNYVGLINDANDDVGDNSEEQWGPDSHALPTLQRLSDVAFRVMAVAPEPIADLANENMNRAIAAYRQRTGMAEEIREQVFHAGMTEGEYLSAIDALDIEPLIYQRMSEYFTESIGDIEETMKLMRADLGVTDRMKLKVAANRKGRSRSGA